MGQTEGARGPADGWTAAPDRLVDQFRLERVGASAFRGVSADAGTQALFGGQVLAQGLIAAGATVNDQVAHSLHAYFLRPGKVASVTYEIERVRDGQRFSARRVQALQDGRAILHMLLSFQRSEPGVEHQQAMPPVAPPEHARPVPRLGIFACPIQFRIVEPDAAPLPGAGRRMMWFRSGRLPDDPLVHQAMLAYVSDHSLLSVALEPHGLQFTEPDVQAASIDHALWFHREFRCDDWLLYVMESPSAAKARGFCRGSMFARDGRLVASVAQEGLVRVDRARLDRLREKVAP